MSLIVSEYDGGLQPDSSVSDWCEKEFWTRKEAAALFTNLDPASIRVNKDKTAFLSMTKLHGRLLPHVDIVMDSDGTVTHVIDAESGNEAYEFEQYSDVLKRLSTVATVYQREAPTFWITAALSLGIAIPWIEWAERKKLISSASLMEQQVQGKNRGKHARQFAGSVCSDSECSVPDGSHAAYLDPIGGLVYVITRREASGGDHVATLTTQNALYGAVDDHFGKNSDNPRPLSRSYLEKLIVPAKKSIAKTEVDLSLANNKSITSYTDLIGVLVQIALVKLKAGSQKRFTRFDTEKDLIDSIIKNCGASGGLARNNLEKEFAAGREALEKKN